MEVGQRGVGNLGLMESRMEKNVENEVDTQNCNGMSTHPTVFQYLNRNAQIPSPTKSEPQNPKPRNPKPQNPDPNRAEPLLRQMATFTTMLRSARTRCGGKVQKSACVCLKYFSAQNSPQVLRFRVHYAKQWRMTWRKIKQLGS